MSDRAHVFPCTAAVCNSSPAWWLWGTPQMFRCFSLENKQNRLFSSGQRDCPNKSWGLFGPLTSTDEVTMCSILLGLRVVLNLVLDAVCFYVCTCYVRRIPLIVLECRGGALWIMNWRKTCSEHSPVLPASPMIYTLAFSRSILAPRGLAGPQVKTWVRQKWNERRAKHKGKRLVWFLFACCAPNVCLTVS